MSAARTNHINYLSFALAVVGIFATDLSHASAIFGSGNCGYLMDVFNGNNYDRASSPCSTAEQDTSGSIEADTSPRGLLSTSVALELARMSFGQTSLKPLAPIVYSAYEIKKTYGDIGVATYAGAAAYANNNLINSSVTTLNTYTAEASAGVGSIDSILVSGKNNALNGMNTTISLDLILKAYLGAISSFDGLSSAYSVLQGDMTIWDDSYSRIIYSKTFQYGSSNNTDPEFSANCGNFPEQHCADSLAYFEDKISFDAVVGHAYTVSSHINSYSVDLLEVANNTGIPDLEGNSTHASSLNSLSAFLTPDDKDVFLVSESGHDYSIQAAQAVPEPPSIYMVLVGLLFVLSRFQNKRIGYLGARQK